MKAPLLIQFAESGAHTVHTFPNWAAYSAHLAAEEAQAQAKGLKLRGYAARGSRKANFYVTHPANQPARLPTHKELRAILKQYSEAQR